MAAFGPRRVAFPEDLSADPSTFQLVANSYTVLDVADIVFFDPASTGYSRVAAGVKPEAYFSIEADARQLVQLIQAWSERHGRTASPKYLFGESYGTLRAAIAAQQMTQSQPALRVDGVFLMGQALNIIEMAQRPGNVTSYAVSLPTLSALGWYHDKINRKGRTFEQLMAQSRRFAQNEYLRALFQGSDLPAQERTRIAERLEDLTGLPASVFEARNLRVSKDTYRVELLKDHNLVLGAYDGRYVTAPTKEDQVPDASMAPLTAIFEGFDRYARDDLKIRTPLEYRTDSPVSELEGWDWGKSKSPFGDWPYMEAVRKVMEQNPKFRVVVASGYHDTATTVGASEYAVVQSGWPRDRVALRYYPGGHMAYTIESSLKLMMDDVRTFVTAP
jgi:carboxypeptidase C (cathepsin A)